MTPTRSRMSRLAILFLFMVIGEICCWSLPLNNLKKEKHNPGPPPVEEKLLVMGIWSEDSPKLLRTVECPQGQKRDSNGYCREVWYDEYDIPEPYY